MAPPGAPSTTAALATLDVYEETGAFENAAALASKWGDAVHALRGRPHVIDVRNLGLVAGIELSPRPGQPGARGMEAFRRAFEQGILVRVTGDIIAMSPPLILDHVHIDRLCSTLAEVLDTID